MTRNDYELLAKVFSFQARNYPPSSVGVVVITQLANHLCQEIAKKDPFFSVDGFMIKSGLQERDETKDIPK